MRAILMSVRVAPVRGALSHGDMGIAPIKVLHNNNVAHYAIGCALKIFFHSQDISILHLQSIQIWGCIHPTIPT